MKKFDDYESIAMLNLSDIERARLKKRFDSVTAGFSALDAYNTEKIEPLVSVLDSFNVFREDITEKNIKRDELLKTAPQQHDGYFQVPAAID